MYCAGVCVCLATICVCVLKLLRGGGGMAWGDAACGDPAHLLGAADPRGVCEPMGPQQGKDGCSSAGVGTR